MQTKRKILGIVTSTVVSTLLVATAVFAVTTISTNIDTGGNLIVGETAAITGNTTISGTLGVTGATTLTGALTANGNVTLGDAATDVVTITGAIVSPLTLKQTAANYTLQWSNPAAARTLTIPDPLGNDTFVFLAATQTLTNKTLTAPRIGTSILDSNGEVLFGLTATASAVNYLGYANAATDSNPAFSATGTGTNIGLNLVMKETGVLTVSTTTANADTLSLLPAAGGTATFAGTITSADLTANKTWTFPNTTGNIAIIDGTLAVATGKTATINNTLTLAGTDGTTMTFPALSGTVVTSADTGTVTSTIIADGTIATVDIADANVTTAKIADAAITQPKVKTKTAVALGDAAATLTATQMIDSGIFTITPTLARILTTDTAANLVAGMPGYQVGSWFRFTIVNTAAYDVTLAAGTGVTLVGKTVINNVSGTWLARFDSSTAVTIYRE